MNAAGDGFLKRVTVEGAALETFTDAGGNRKNETYMPTLRWRHDGPVWKAEGGVGYSRARYNGGDLARGYFQSTSARRTGVTVAFDDVF